MLQLDDKNLLNEIWPKGTDDVDADSFITPRLKRALRAVLGDIESGESLSDVRTSYIHNLWKMGVHSAICALCYWDLREKREPTALDDALVANAATRALEEYFRAYCEFESLLYGSDPWYRDHVIHVIRVWLTGAYVLRRLEGLDGLVIDDHFSEVGPGSASDQGFRNLRDLTTPEERFAMWTLVALTHDLGYPLEKAKRLNDAVGALFDAFGPLVWEPLKYHLSGPQHELARYTQAFISAKPSILRRDGCQDLASAALKKARELLEKHKDNPGELRSELAKTPFTEQAFCIQRQNKFFQKFGKALEFSQHGVLSALILQRTLHYFLEAEYSDNEDHGFDLRELRAFLIPREVLRAIAAHTCHEIYYLHTLRLDALLYFCDEMQEWRRPHFRDLYGGWDKRLDVKVELKEYSSKSVSYEIDLFTVSRTEFGHRVLHSASSLATVLRPAPQDQERGFRVNLLVKGKVEDQEARANYVEDGAGGRSLSMVWGVRGSDNGWDLVAEWQRAGAEPSVLADRLFSECKNG